VITILDNTVSFQNDVDKAVLSHYVSGLTPGTAYSFKVEAVDWSGNPSTTGPTLAFRTVSNGAPAVAMWIRYCYLFVIPVAAIRGIAAAIIFRRRRKEMGHVEKPLLSG